MLTACGSSSSDSAADASASGTPDAASAADGASVDAAPVLGPAAACYDGVFAGASPVSPDYDQFSPVVGSHCKGTNHQDITGIERVVFLGDSVTVGTPPTLAGNFYRSRLADGLAAKFGLDAPNGLWKEANPTTGKALIQDSGDFSSCSEWGARTDDLLLGGNQISDCFPQSELDKRTLVIMTMGGNDIASVTKDGIDGVPVEDLWMDIQDATRLMREAIDWFYEPDRFPNGVYVVFANMFEFTDGTADTEACPAAELAGFGGDWEDPQALVDMIIWANEQFMQIAVETGTDMIFMLEEFCGHGFNNDDPSAPCYRGPDADRWFDLTCIHPNPTGHGSLVDIFMSVIDE